MKDLSRGFAKVLFFFVSGVLLLWTGRMSYTLLSELLPDLLFAGLFGLILFEGGLLAWLYIFINGAEGQGQRITAILLTVFDFLGVGALSLVKLYTSGQDFTEVPEGLPLLALWVVVIATIINLGGVVAYHLFDPSAVEAIAMQAQRDKLRARTFEIFGQKIDAVAEDTSDRLAEVMRDNLLNSMQVSLSTNGTKPEGEHSPKIKAGGK